MSRSKTDGARSVITQIWHRARINAFAHREAADEAERKATVYFRSELITAIVGIMCIILVYVLTTQEKSQNTTVAILILTIGSISCTLFALYLTVMANYMKFDMRYERHAQLQSMYQYLAQRAREVKWPDRPDKDVIDLLKDLERDFALLKLKGLEPQDRHFDRAIEIFKKIQSDDDTRIAQSFEVGEPQEMGQQEGEPHLEHEADGPESPPESKSVANHSTPESGNQAPSN